MLPGIGRARATHIMTLRPIGLVEHRLPEQMQIAEQVGPGMSGFGDIQDPSSGLGVGNGHGKLPAKFRRQLYGNEMPRSAAQTA
jgi:hypothetical protein